MKQERDELLQKIWVSQNQVSMLRSLNSEMIGEINTIKTTIKKQSKQAGAIASTTGNERSTSPIKGIVGFSQRSKLNS